MANEQRFESLNDESLNTVDLFSNRKRKGMGVSEYVRPGKARRWSDVEVDHLGKSIWRGFVFFRFWVDFGLIPLSPGVASNMLHSFGHLVQHCNIIRQMLDDVAIFLPIDNKQ